MMSKWQTKKLSKVTEKIFSGGTPATTNKAYWNGDINWLSSGETSNRFIFDTIQKISLLGVENSSTKLALQWDTVIASAGQGKTRGQTALLKVDSYINQSIIALRANRNEITPLWLFYNLSNRYSELRNISDSHSSRGSLTTALLKDLEISFPSINEQDKITGILFAIDNKIQLNTQTNQTLEQIAQAIFKHWFIDFAPVHAKANALARGETIEQAELAAMACLSGKTAEKITALQHTAPEAYHQLQQTARAFPSEFVESEMGLVPKGWEWLKIENIISRLKNKQKINKNNISDIGNIPVFEQGQNILMGYHSDNPAFIATPQDPIFIFGDHTCMTHISTKPFSIYQNVIPIKGKDIPTLWVYLAVKDKQKFQEYRRHWMEFIIKEICLPNRDLIEHFVELVTHLFEKKDAIYEQNKILRKVRDELLPKLLSGEIEL
ncbi:restriction endonuclease subunit S [Gallibacterium anatis]|uniref:restriction endonuclease subunit S n=2 Tax=Gallibacterium anatis TaxID=750 RepID=UPI003007A3F7